MNLDNLFFLRYTIKMDNEKDNKLEITSTDAVAVLLITASITGAYIIWCVYEKNSWNLIITNSGTAIPLFTLMATLLLKIKDWVIFMFRQADRYKKKIMAEGRAEGKAEGKAERDAEWIEWAANGKDPDKMPSIVNPVKPVQKEK
ncbi:hypothetical protein C6501_17400 [Candidatus Poribacteria bacterium]|nr:MAG: hypothetical protein C6501_17400 [Candidatus Poribacteria bacterium]